MPIKPANRRKYPVYWTMLSRFIRFGRAKARCECTGECGDAHAGGRCEERDGQLALSFEGTVRLAAAHLDHDPANNFSRNVKALCQRCHLRHDRWHHAAERARTRRRVRDVLQYCLALVLPGPPILEGVQLPLFGAAAAA